MFRKTFLKIKRQNSRSTFKFCKKIHEIITFKPFLQVSENWEIKIVSVETVISGVV